MKPHQSPLRGGYQRPEKERELEVGWSCVLSMILVLVTGALSLCLALMRFEGEDRGQEDSRNVIDLVSNTNPLGGTKQSAETRPEMQIYGLTAMDPPEVASGFFMEIGTNSSSVSRSIRSSILEKKGFSGLCVVPFPVDFHGRRCRVVAVAVGGAGGGKVAVEDCSQQQQLLDSFAGFIKKLNGQDKICPHVEATTVGIVDFLSLSGAPPVIDYIALDTNGTELEILEHFPFSDFCSRSWTVRHDYHAGAMDKLRHIFEVNHGCRVREGAGEFWARCGCERNRDPSPGVVTPEKQDSEFGSVRSDGPALVRK